MKLRNILITVVAMGMMFASWDRTSVVGYTEGDYTDMNTFAHKAAGQNVAYTTGDDFTAVWTDGGTTWGFSSGASTELANMMWSNGTYGLAVGLDMPAGGDTTFDLGFGMNLMGYDVGFAMSTEEDSAMNLNVRGKCGFWAFDTMTFGYTGDPDWSSMDVNFYGVNDWGAATGMFGLGFTSSDSPAYAVVMDDGVDETAGTADDTYVSGWADPVTMINTSFSVESTLTDWCDLRIGYSKSFNMAAVDGEDSSADSYSAGLGFNYGSVALDMTISSTTLNNMVSNPLEYVNGRNDAPLAASWTLTYAW